MELVREMSNHGLSARTSESWDMDFKLWEMDPLCLRMWVGRREAKGGDWGREDKPGGEAFPEALAVAARTSLSWMAAMSFFVKPPQRPSRSSLSLSVGSSSAMLTGVGCLSVPSSSRWSKLFLSSSEWKLEPVETRDELEVFRMGCCSTNPGDAIPSLNLEDMAGDRGGGSTAEEAVDGVLLCDAINAGFGEKARKLPGFVTSCVSEPFPKCPVTVGSSSISLKIELD